MPPKEAGLRGEVCPPTGYKFAIPDPHATVDRPPQGCIVVYWAALFYGLRFPLHRVVVEILNKYKFTLAQVMPTSWHNVYSFIATCELCRLSCTGRAFKLVHTIQNAPSEITDTGWCSFNNTKGFMMAIGKKSKLKN